jgi:hypothetical protein
MDRLCDEVEIHLEPDRPQMAVWRMHIALWIPKATNTHSGCVIVIFFHSNNYCTNRPLFYVIGKLPVLFSYTLESRDVLFMI